MGFSARTTGSRNASLALAYRLALAAEDHWRKLNASDLIPLVRTGVRFQDGLNIGVHPETAEALIPVELRVRIATFEDAIHNIRQYIEVCLCKSLPMSHLARQHSTGNYHFTDNSGPNDPV